MPLGAVSVFCSKLVIDKVLLIKIKLSSYCVSIVTHMRDKAQEFLLRIEFLGEGENIINKTRRLIEVKISGFTPLNDEIDGGTVIGV